MIPQVTYIIPYWDPHADDKFVMPRYVSTIEKLYANCDPNITKEVFVIDQGNPEKARQKTRELQKKYGFGVIELPSNLGVSGGINVGFNMARGKYIAILSSDVLMTKGCDTECILFMNATPNVYQTTPTADKSDYAHQMCPVNEPFASNEVNTLPIMSKKGNVATKSVCVELSLNYFRRECIKEIGYFDEIWKACFEIADYDVRIVLAGRDIAVIHSAYIWHWHNTSNQYIGLLEAYTGYLKGDPFQDQRIANIMWNKWSPDIRDETQWHKPMGISPAQIIALKEKYKHNIYLGYPQDRNY